MIAILAGPKESAADWVVEMNQKNPTISRYLYIVILSCSEKKERKMDFQYPLVNKHRP
jgi:hypothetical protein